MPCELFTCPDKVQELEITPLSMDEKIHICEAYNTASDIDNKLYYDWKEENARKRHATQDLFSKLSSPEHFIAAIAKMKNQRVIDASIYTTLAAIGVSRESIKTFLLSEEWEYQFNRHTWKNKKGNINNLNDINFVKSILHMIFYGYKWPVIKAQTQKKLSWEYCKDVMSTKEEILDNMILDGLDGSYSSNKGNYVQKELIEIIREILNRTENDLEFGTSKNDIRFSDCNLTCDDNPVLIGECSYVNSTSSAQSDKSDTVRELFIHAKSQKAFTFFFVDGLAWRQRKQDLMKILQFADIIVTGHAEQINKFCGHITWLCNNVKSKRNISRGLFGAI